MLQGTKRKNVLRKKKVKLYLPVKFHEDYHSFPLFFRRHKKRGMLSVILCHILQPEGKISVALLKKI